MKISLKWLKKYIDFNISAKELSHRLTLSGLVVEKEEFVEDDTVFELEIMPNRPDCLSFFGHCKRAFRYLGKSLKTGYQRSNSPRMFALSLIEDKKDCARYIGAVLSNVHVSDSPRISKKIFWLWHSNVNNIVDITNFCLMENGQPLHAFDHDKLIGGKVIVLGKAGEDLVINADVVYTPTPSILVIRRC